MASRTPPTLTTAPAEPAPDRRQEILNAALACAADGGVDAVSIDGVRAHCGASVGSIYHHFGNRDGIVAALFFDIFHDQSRAVQAQLDAALGVEAGVRALVTGYLDWVVAQPERARFLFQARGAVAAGPRTPDLADAARRRNQALVAWFEPHRRAGAVRDLPCELMPSLVMGPVQSYCRAWLSGNAGPDGLPSPTTYRAELADAAWRAVRV
ncbi:TetR/AcrR family transcriptional regulator [Acidovorax sp. FJL06]|uniref:TetR/AcrR family transcriptional regulator n=1 Tax=Acidovorax sp. FJL06 TaxID=2153365 RepID=UPI000F566D96|nr:TetR/AcrR family transcriptional regulator [Acidovorax sp. FJL06]RQO82410.1 TetR family transcriptional regulator [Acidovorax sp. FJL06]